MTTRIPAPKPKDAVPHIPPFKDGTLGDIAGRIMNEVDRQDDMARAGRFGGTHIMPGGPDEDRLGVLVEEVGEVAKELNEDRMGSGSRERLFDELIQVGAVAAAWAAAIQEGRS